MKKILNGVAKDLWVVVLDLVAVNLSYYLALLIRFFVGGELRAVAVDRYMPAWISFTPWYSVLAIIIFMAWKLYGGMWRYASINDMNRIIRANVCTTILNILGTTLFFTRMPWTYYAIGAVLQFFLVHHHGFLGKTAVAPASSHSSCGNAPGASHDKPALSRIL